MGHHRRHRYWLLTSWPATDWAAAVSATHGVCCPGFCQAGTLCGQGTPAEGLRKACSCTSREGLRQQIGKISRRPPTQSAWAFYWAACIDTVYKPEACTSPTAVLQYF
eukprot:243630-Chlamydomonas_euryale.AAC.9